MISEKMQNAINDQINAEFYSSYFYLSMSAYCESENFKGFAEWFRLQAEEEKMHGFRLFDYLQERGGRAILKAIEAPPTEFKSVQETFEKTLEHERKDEKDYATQAHLQWFITEQVEEEATAEDILNQIKMVEGKTGSMFYIDRHIVKTRQSSAESE
jgi:ferritin